MCPSVLPGIHGIVVDESLIIEVCQGGVVGSKAIEHIVSEVGTEVEAQVPILVLELRVQAHKYLRHRTFARKVLVGLRNLTILVPVHYRILNRISLVIIHLLIEIERARCIAYLMILNGGTRSKRGISRGNTRIVGIVSSRQLGDAALVPREVIAQLPTEILALDSHGIHIELNPLVLHPSHIGGNDVREVRTCRSTHTVQQVTGTLVVILDGTGNPVVQETEIKTKVVGRGFLPLQVRTIAIRLQEIGTEILPRGIGSQRISGQIEVITDFLLTRYPITDAELQVGKYLTSRFHPRFIQDGPGKGQRRECTPTMVGTESGRTVTTQGSRQQITVLVVPIHTAEEGNQVVLLRDAMKAVLPETSFRFNVSPTFLFSKRRRV